MTSTTTLLPLDYYHLPFCFPDGNVVELDTQNLGQFLSGDRIQSSPYRLNMKVDMYCEQLGIGNLGREQQEGIHPNKMVEAIQKNYHHNWIVDNLPAATKYSTIRTSYIGGFPVGFIHDYTKKAYIYNHVNIEIQYHNVENEPDRARIVRFTVQPFSIKHDFATNAGGNGPFKVADIQNRIQSCNHKNRSKEHTRYEMVHANDRGPQPAHGGVLFTYDVIWTENVDLHWSSRWYIYLTMDNAIPAEIHWFSIWNSLFMVILLSAMIATILVRNLRRDFKYYKRLVTDEEKAESIIIEFSWKLVHADVFRAPNFSPLLLAVCCGTGAQLLCTAFWTILLSAIGFVNPARRGSLLMALIVLYALSGSVAGYVTARFYKTFRGKSWQKATKCTAFGFPGIAFGLLLVVDIVVLWQSSTHALPIMTIVMLLFLWLGISTPLVFFGAYIGYRQDVIILVSTRSAPRRIPAQVFNLPITVTMAACLTFSPCMVEFYFILASVWGNQYYNAFGFLLLLLFILILMCALVTILFNFIRINGENYRWWWSSFSTGGSTGLGAFFYSFVFIRKFGIGPFSFPSFVIYFGFAGLASLGLFLMTGFVGISACLWFNKAMFASIITDRGISPVSASDFLPISASDLHSRNNHNISSMIRKALIAAFTLTALFSPALFSPSRSGGVSDHQNQWHNTQQMERNAITDSRKLPEDLTHSGDADYRPTAVVRNNDSGINVDHDDGEGVGNDGDFELDRVGDNAFAYREKGERFVSAKKVHKPLANLHPTYDAHDVLEIAIVASLWAAIIVLSVIVKRRSARPGGRVYLYNQSRVHKILSERRRRLNDILKDPILKDDMKRRYGDLTSLLAVVAEWQSHGFQQKKDECVKIGKWVAVPWIRHVNGCLFFITYMTFYCGFDEVLSLMILSMAFVHLIDNMVLYRAATVKGAPRIAESKSLFAAVGIPVIEI
eukprot:CAMPEP_0201871400 /NCGR_PEP_ID=MMETSP0902-20130614/4321_1 /ASSEMBLY_ACC=CAM_ASM_000551 /TAXON_ID=420261 /ORGANISM="Thalassiosira antarctica, Strain CCMP982" /LENGTH=951 /DNA_ID=CAMNT_0048397369 /DNA_START=166 /DNA_END=3021 /DNA_ORIENTATION=-